MIKYFNAKFPWLFQFVRFGIVGLSNTFISLVTYEILVYFNFNPQIANFIAFFISVINAYLWNNIWVFKGTKSGKSSIYKFILLYSVTFLISVGLLHLWIDVLHVSKYIAPMISLIITIPINFLISKFWVFKSKKETQTD